MFLLKLNGDCYSTNTLHHLRSINQWGARTTVIFLIMILLYMCMLFNMFHMWEVSRLRKHLRCPKVYSDPGPCPHFKLRSIVFLVTFTDRVQSARLAISPSLWTSRPQDPTLFRQWVYNSTWHTRWCHDMTITSTLGHPGLVRNRFFDFISPHGMLVITPTLR